MINMVAKVLLGKILRQEDSDKGSQFLRIFLILFLVGKQTIPGKKVILEARLRLKQEMMF
jgi:hypothetical protein